MRDERLADPVRVLRARRVVAGIGDEPRDDVERRDGVVEEPRVEVGAPVVDGLQGAEQAQRERPQELERLAGHDDGPVGAGPLDHAQLQHANFSSGKGTKLGPQTGFMLTIYPPRATL